MAIKINSRRFLWPVLWAILTAFALLGVILIGLGPNDAGASSHREAPLISKDPSADNVDTYVFIPEGVTDTIVLAATWIPFEAPEGGPNYFEWDDNVRYDIYVDNDGDARPEITYTLESQTASGDMNSFLYNTGPITTLDDSDWKRSQRYTVTEVSESGGAVTIVGNVLAPPVNIGSKSTPDYADLAAEATYTMDVGGDEIKVFAGPRDDPFWVDLQVFDLLTLRGQDAPVGYSTGNNIPVDSLSGFNAHALVIEVPISRVVDADPVLGVWAGSRRQSTVVLNPGGLGGLTPSGPFVQVSRLGMPLVNEVVLPMTLKDVFNGIRPEADLGAYALLQESVENPEVGTLLCALYSVPLPGDANADCNTEYTGGTPRTGRGDIFDIFLTGMVLANEFTIQAAAGPVTLPAGFNVNQPEPAGPGSVTPAEMIHINTAISGDLCHPGGPQRLGVLAGDACGFPNGRRLTDDIIEIELLAVAGAAYEVLDDRDASFSFNSALAAVLDDGLDGNDVSFLAEFPYLAPPHSGQEHLHQNPRVPVYLPVVRK
jgi:hypothetical protein